MALLPGMNVRDLLSAGSKLTEDRDRPLRIVIVVELDAPDPVLVALENAFRPNRARVDVAVGVAGQDAPRLTTQTDVVIGVAGSGGPQLAAYLSAAREQDLPVVAIALPPEGGRARSLRQPLDDFLVGEDATVLVHDDLGTWLADHLAGKRLALAAAFDFLRSCVANEFVKSTSWQNALIGGIAIIPGADMPLMTGNQAKMVLQIAAAYGQKLDTERAKELLVVVGGGFAFRAVARQLLDFVPGFGWALKAGIGYTGTMAMGKAAIVYFEDGADLSRLLADLKGEAAVLRERVTLPRGEQTKALPESGDDAPAPYKVEASGADVTPG